jgi:hypothetical protein
MYREALQIDQDLGRYNGMANQYHNIGEVLAARGDVAAAREMWTNARDLLARIGAKHLAGETQGLIDKLPKGLVDDSITERPPRSYARESGFSCGFAMVLAIGFFLLVSLVLTAVARSLARR